MDEDFGDEYTGPARKAPRKYVAPTASKPRPMPTAASTYSTAAATSTTAATHHHQWRSTFNPQSSLITSWRDSRLGLLDQEVLFIPEAALTAPLPWHRPHQGVCSRMLHAVTNKQRCAINCVVWMPCGDQIMTGASTGEFTLWDALELGKFDTIIQAHDGSAVRAMSWVQAQQWLLSGDDVGTLKYWQPNLNNVKKVGLAHSGAIRSISGAPYMSAKFVTCGDDCAVTLWDFERALPERPLGLHGSEARGVAWHPCKALVASCGKDSCVRLIDPRVNTTLRKLYVHSFGASVVAWSPWHEALLLTCGGDSLVKLHDVRHTKEPLFSLKGHAKDVTCGVFHPEIPDVVCTGGGAGELLQWDAASGVLLSSTQAHESSVWAVAYNTAGNALASASNDFSTKIWARELPLAAAAASEKPRQEKEFVPQAAAAAAAPAETPQLKRQRPPPDTYTCRKCHVKGHWITDCTFG